MLRFSCPFLFFAIGFFFLVAFPFSRSSAAAEGGRQFCGATERGSSSSSSSKKRERQSQSQSPTSSTPSLLYRYSLPLATC
ncbi:unnamed protein product [Linum trigynum]|uniref:Secreted protein n=1 Tax=Linum trigynum TaxID=586398 RepID=A0AAV2FMZ6_9ROSI